MNTKKRQSIPKVVTAAISTTAAKPAAYTFDLPVSEDRLTQAIERDSSAMWKLIAKLGSDAAGYDSTSAQLEDAKKVGLLATDIIEMREARHLAEMSELRATQERIDDDEAYQKKIGVPKETP